MRILIILIAGLMVVVGCGNSDKVKLLEEENKRLKAEAKTKRLEEKPKKGQERETVKSLPNPVKTLENWETNRQVAKNQQLVKNLGGIEAYLDPKKLDKPLDKLMDQLTGRRKAREAGFSGQAIRGGAAITASLMELAGGAAVQAAGVDFGKKQVPVTGKPGEFREETFAEQQTRINTEMGGSGFAQMRQATIGEMAKSRRETWGQIARLMEGEFGVGSKQAQFAREQAASAEEIATRQFDEKFNAGQIPSK
jgi:hypothetical protein